MKNLPLPPGLNLSEAPDIFNRGAGVSPNLPLPRRERVGVRGEFVNA